MRELEVAIDLPTFNALTDAFVRNGRLGQAGLTLTLTLNLTLTLALALALALTLAVGLP